MSPIDTLRRFVDLVACAVVALLGIALPIISPSGVATAVFGVLLVLFASGYALGCALWDSESDLAIGDRIAFSVGLSVSLSVFTVLALSVSGVGIFPLTVTVALGYETLAFSLLAVTLRQTRAQEIPREIRQAISLSRGVLRSNRPFWALVLALLVVAAAIFVVILATPEPGAGPQFYVVGPDGTASSLPRTLVVNQPTSVLVGAANEQGPPLSFTVTVCLVKANGTCPSSPARYANWSSLLSFAENSTYLLNLTVGGSNKPELSLPFLVSVGGDYTLAMALDGAGVHREVRLPLSVVP